jgi:lincosamide nucleotidyltransferase A/C/D/E
VNLGTEQSLSSQTPRAIRASVAVILNEPVVGPAAKRLSHMVAGAPRWSPLRLLRPLRSTLKGEADATRVVEILDSLEQAGVTHWLAGGWGVDALVGRQTRRHDDVDIVIDNFPLDAPKACAALASIGFRVTERHFQATWMPDQWTLEDDGACRIDLLSLDWQLLGSRMSDGAGLPAATSREGLLAQAVTTGTIGSRHLPCLSATVQRLFHSGFEPRHVDRHDIAELTARGLS